LGSLLADPWSGGQSRYGNTIETPQRGTLIGPAGMRSDLRDDPVAEAVRTELEGSIYSASSLVVGPQVTVFDFAGSRQAVDLAPRQFNLNAPLEIPAPPEGYFRFAHLRLRSDVAIDAPGLAAQIGETLWQVLYPEAPGSTPADFREHHLAVAGDSVGVWGDRGIAIAQKRDFGSGPRTPGEAAELRKSFSAIISLVRDVDRFTADCDLLNEHATTGMDLAAASSLNINLQAWQLTEHGGQELARRAAEIKISLALPDQDLARRFYDFLGIEQLLVTLGNLTNTASAYLRRHQEAEQAKQAEARNAVTARIRRRLEWLEVASIGFLIVLILHMATHEATYSVNLQRAIVTFGAPLVAGLFAWWLKPWRRKPEAAPGKTNADSWILFVVALAAVLAWLAGVVDVWMK
jgi:hypothetical protein